MPFNRKEFNKRTRKLELDIARALRDITNLGASDETVLAIRSILEEEQKVIVQRLLITPLEPAPKKEKNAKSTEHVHVELPR